MCYAEKGDVKLLKRGPTAVALTNNLLRHRGIVAIHGITIRAE